MKTIKIVAIVWLVYFASACDLDQTEIISNDDLTQALEDDNKGVLRIGENTYIFNDNSKGTITKFKGNSRKHEFFYDTESLNIREQSLENMRISDNSFVIKNDITEEYIEIQNITEENDGYIKFDIQTSVGDKLEGIKLQLPNTLQAGNLNSRVDVFCWWCLAYPIVKLVEVILDSTNDDFDSNCRIAISSCGDNGVASIELTEGWFSTSCSVQCNPNLE